MAKPSYKRFKQVTDQNAGNITKIAEAFGVSRLTVYRWTDLDDAFREAVEEHRGRLVDKCLNTAQIVALGIPARDENGNFVGWKERPDGNMLRYLLGTFGQREGFSNDIRLSGKIEYDKLSDKQLDTVIKGVTSRIRNNIQDEK